MRATASPGSSTTRLRLAFATLLALGGLLSGCGDTPTAPTSGQAMEIAFTSLDAVDASQGRLEVWVYQGADTVSVGSLAAGSGPVPTLGFIMPLDRASGALVTLEPPGDADGRPSRSVLMRGPFDGGRARLRIEGAMTLGGPFEDAPGAHSLFTTSNNVELGYPSYENAGLWLFSVVPSRNKHGTREVKLTTLRSGWVYEGWIVLQQEPEVWISYGKYRPDELGLLTSRDDSGAGPFSGDEDFRNAGVEDVPGEEWTTDRIAQQLGFHLPGGLPVPLTLDAVDGAGNALWHHVITVEPAYDESERPLEGRPFVVRPYENEIGPGGPGVPRVIRLVNPGPEAEVRRAPGG